MTVVIRRFFPSGSSKKKNIDQEKIIDVITKINSGFFFGDMNTLVD